MFESFAQRLAEAPSPEEASVFVVSLWNSLRRLRDDVWATDRCAGCYRHEQRCRVDLESAMAFSARTFLEIAGSSCTDYSSVGRRRQEFGVTTATLLAWVVDAATIDMVSTRCVGW